MFIIIPLGGIGKRFKDNGYTFPKALIKALGKPILYYVLDNLNLTNIDFVYIPYNKEYHDYRLESQLIKDYPNIKFKFFMLKENTGGAAETINLSLHHLDLSEDCPVMCIDGDNFYTEDILINWDGTNSLVVFNDSSSKPIYSYIQVSDDTITNIVEKKKVSDLACSGAYGFESWKSLLNYSQKIIDNNIRQKGEFYTSNVISQMIQDNIIFKYQEISNKNWHCLGTPFQVRVFCNNYPKISCLSNKKCIQDMRICFDLDNTLVTFPTIKGDYSSVLPIEKNINYLKYLKSFGYTIIIYTARRMKTHGGNIGKILCDIGKITFDTLDKFKIPYDEIYFGKPYANIYIDDLGLNCFNDLERNLGFYLDNISPRSFNTINSTSIELYTKKSYNLDGEIYYYRNIPRKIKDLFPILIDFDDNSKWYTMEKVKGLTVTSLFTSELLTSDNLIHVLNSICRIQSLVPNDTVSIDIYENYLPKIKKRYQNYDYSKFPKSEKVYSNLIDFFEKYQQSKLGKCVCIHGDPVMTNIIINSHGKIKFIDMRGKIGDKLSIFGDWLYDWAKIYQSLIGYDLVLQDKKISDIYHEDICQTFRNYFIEKFTESDFENLKWITKSLLFTLIPLHDNDKCLQYYDLIEKI